VVVGLIMMMMMRRRRMRMGMGMMMARHDDDDDDDDDFNSNKAEFHPSKGGYLYEVYACGGVGEEDEYGEEVGGLLQHPVHHLDEHVGVVHELHHQLLLLLHHLRTWATGGRGMS
jgi:hypothetical protein